MIERDDGKEGRQRSVHDGHDDGNNDDRMNERAAKRGPDERSKRGTHVPRPAQVGRLSLEPSERASVLVERQARRRKRTRLQLFNRLTFRRTTTPAPPRRDATRRDQDLHARLELASRLDVSSPAAAQGAHTVRPHCGMSSKPRPRPTFRFTRLLLARRRLSSHPTINRKDSDTTLLRRRRGTSGCVALRCVALCAWDRTPFDLVAAGVLSNSAFCSMHQLLPLIPSSTCFLYFFVRPSIRSYHVR